MICFPNAKINLGLRILNKRDDGFHNIETVFVPVALKDILEIVPSSDNTTSIKISGVAIDGSPDKNLCMKAAALMRLYYHIPDIQLHLHKIIPMGAGLGGGSADAAFTIKTINKLFNLGVSADRMKQIASELGSDCAFFIDDAVSFGSQRGEVLEKIKVGVLETLTVVLVKPQLHISTAEAYARVIPNSSFGNLKKLVLEPVNRWKETIVNDFEQGLMELYPEIEEIKQQLYKKGALYASLSGSGSALFALFDVKPEDIAIDFPGCFVWKGQCRAI